MYFFNCCFFFLFHFSFRKLCNESSVQTFHLHQKFLIVVTKDVPNVLESLHNIFGIVMKLGLLNVNVLIKEANATMWTLHMYKPYVRHCHSIDIFKIGTFSSENYTNILNTPPEDLFPSKQPIFRMCPIFVTTIRYEPFVIIRKESNGSITYDGIDVKIVNEISKTLNLIPVYMQAPDKNNRGMIFPNGTSTGALSLVWNNFYHFLVKLPDFQSIPNKTNCLIKFFVTLRVNWTSSSFIDTNIISQ